MDADEDADIEGPSRRQLARINLKVMICPNLLCLYVHALIHLDSPQHRA